MELFSQNCRLVFPGDKFLPPSDPQLPRPLWERYKRDFPDSTIFTLYFSDIRQIMVVEGPTPALDALIPAQGSRFVQWMVAADFPDRDLSYLNLSEHMKPVDRGLSYLHLAVAHGDLPLAHESLRLGIPVDCKDKAGKSPLFSGLEVLFGSHSGFIPTRLHVANELLVAKVHRVCLFLISHHANPNETHGNSSLLSHACVVRSWDLISALLRHGATSKPGLSRMFEGAERTRFESLVSTLSTAIRPPRICPCGSERPLKDCHANPQLYPAESICPCGSRKIHAACCAQRADVLWSEKWNFIEKMGWLVYRRSKKAADYSPNGIIRSILPPRPDLESATPETFLSILKVLAKNHQIDPAYAAASKQTMLAPSPAAAMAMPKTEWIEVMKTWNDAVDAYIASGAARCAPEIIETAAKIGPSGGPLYSKCEAPECTNVESSKLAEVFSRCSGCKTAVYCSRSCQKSAWGAHKPACRAGKVRAQMIPSQETYAAELARVNDSTTGGR
ncbi:hypothetical protein DFH09DRAFT_1410410 [Mycena vulgaris]|nr:hypothetical protein DFH09DRAFT_1410410 [Mycena vulgaris]